VRFLVRHLLHPSTLQVILTHQFLVALLSILGSLLIQSCLQTILVHHLFLESRDLAVRVLIIELRLERVICPFNLALVGLFHFLDYLLSLLRPVVWLVVLLVGEHLRVTSFSNPVPLHIDEVLVLLLGSLTLIKSFTHLGSGVLNVVDELSFFRLTKVL
jgi:hypothetical protein